MPHSRSSGILMHITSLPGPEGCGTLGQEAYDFVDQLVEMGQSVWQVLPLSPPNSDGCPYSASSTFANFDLLVSLRDLVVEGWLSADDLRPLKALPDTEMAYAEMVRLKTPILRKAAQQFLLKASSEQKESYQNYSSTHAAWLDDYALFAVLKEVYQRPWMDWPEALRRRDPAALESAKQTHVTAMELVKVAQFFFEGQWQKLRRYTNENGLQIFGDVPIYVAQDSADVWGAQHEFNLDPDTGYPTHIAGCPPDNFCHEGQRWGNPIYNWDAMQADGFSWWLARIERAVDLMDFVRVDHFRGFAAYWSFPYNAASPTEGEWTTAPGKALFDAMRKKFGQDLPLIAEDLGYITPDVIDLRDSYGIFGMKVLNFLVEEADFTGDRHPSQFPKGSVCYMGTHDNDTALGWFNRPQDPGKTIEESKSYRQWLKAVLSPETQDKHGDHWAIIEAVLQSASNMAILQMQDILGLGVEGRMNVPGTAAGQWKWRLLDGALTKVLRHRLYDYTQAASRLPANSARG